MKTKTGKAYVRTQGGNLFNLGDGPVSLRAIEAELPHVQKAIKSLPNGSQKTTIANGFANFYGYVKSCEWLQGVSAPIEA